MRTIALLGCFLWMLIQSAVGQTPSDQNFIAAYQQANEVRLQNRPEEALRLAGVCLEIGVSEHGADSPHAADAYQLIGVILNQLKRHDEAILQFEKSKDIYTKRNGPVNDKTAFAWMKLGEVREIKNEHDEALKCYETSLEMYRKLEPADSPKIARVQSLIGDVYFARHESAAALSRYNAAFESYRKAPNEGVNAAMQLRKIGQVHQLNRDYAQSREYFQACLDVRLRLLGPDDPETARALDDLATALSGLQDYAKAREYQALALEIMKTRYGVRDSRTTSVMSNLATTLTELGELPAARKLFEEAIAIQSTFTGLDAADNATTLNSYANLLIDLDELDEAQQLYERALSAERELYGPLHPRAIYPLVGISNVLGLKQDWRGAEQKQLELLELRRKVRGDKHVDVADVLTNIAISQTNLDNSPAAVESFAKALDIYRELLGEDHPQTAKSHMNLAGELERNGKLAECFDHADRCRRSLRRYVARILPALSDREQLKFLEYRDQQEFFNGLILAHAHRDDPQVAARSAEWVANGKALASEALAARALLARDQRTAGSKGLAQQLADIRGQIAALSIRGSSGDDAAAQQAQIEQLSTLEQQLSRELANVSGAEMPSEWISLNAIREKIPAGSVLVDIVRFRFFAIGEKKSVDRKWLTEHYVAWIVPPAGEAPVRIIDLGEAEPIDKLIHATRMAIESPADIRKVGESEAEQKLLEQMAELSQHTLRVLARELPPDTKRLLLSPDSQLWLLPWAALPLADGRYAIEQYEFQYVVSARDLLSKPAAGKTSNAAIIADPDFELSPRDSLAATEAVLRKRFPSEDLLAMRAVNADTGLPKVERLPGTAAEAEAILPQLQAFTGTTPVVYKDRYALEGVFKALIRPRALVLATHGFFLESKPADAVETPRSALGMSEPNPTVATPLLRCGLILAGFNSHEKEAIGDDGVLTGLEIIGCDLRGTELVVLSACQTGLGQVNNGDGVSGLRQAFQLAGAQSVVATLWQIPDRDTALLMSDFFTKLADGESKSQALRSAQLARIADRRNIGGAAHPLFWAAFTVTGE